MTLIAYLLIPLRRHLSSCIVLNSIKLVPVSPTAEATETFESKHRETFKGIKDQKGIPAKTLGATRQRNAEELEYGEQSHTEPSGCPDFTLLKYLISSLFTLSKSKMK